MSTTEADLEASGGMPPSDFHDHIERLREIAKYDLDIPHDFEQRLEEAVKGLVIPSHILRAAAAALRVGHIVLQGPPGTGKSSLIRALARAFHVSTYAVTAHEDWTTFDVIGRLELRLGEKGEEVVPVNGALTEAVIRCGNNIVGNFDDATHPQAEWLLIDELNRAHLDKAFGELFSVLGTDELVPVNLPHQKDGNRELVIPRRFRIVASLNSYDKQFVQSLSQAIRRRFTFISLDIPPKRPDGESWQFDPANAHPAILEFSYVLSRVAGRVARREFSLSQEKVPEAEENYLSMLTTTHLDRIGKLFSMVETVRYAQEGSDFPHLPVGTAQLLDTVELFFTRHQQDEAIGGNADEQLDWAASVKLAPLFESDVVGPEQLTSLAKSLKAPFSRDFPRELKMIASAGMYFVPGG